MDRSAFVFTNPTERRLHEHKHRSDYLPGWELRVRDGSSEVGGWSRGCEPDDRAVDVDSRGAVGSGHAGGRIDACQQVGPSGSQVEDDVLIDLPRVESR